MSKPLQDYTKEELLAYVKHLKKQKKFGLVWEDKPEQVVTECETKLPVLQEAAERALTADPEKPTHLIIKGDNYHSLSTLNYTHAGKVDVIYIDPPYNTGNKDFIYNDSYVDTEDSFRHSKWLSSMSKRLELAKKLLSDTGVIFISIDDNEMTNLKLLCDQIFGGDNFITQFIWRRSGAGGLRGIFPVTTHEYVLTYGQNKNNLTTRWIAPYSEASRAAFSGSDEKGLYKTQALYLTSLKQTASQSYFIELPDGTRAKPPVGVGSWRFIEETYQKELDAGNIVFKKVKSSPLVLESGEKAAYNIYTKQYISEDGTNPTSILPEDIVGQTRAARAELKKIFSKDVFDYAKPTSLVEFLLKLVNMPKDITILDFMAGSGTTGHAVLKLNEQDGGNRQFILCTNNENGIAENITYQRIKKVTEGYGNTVAIPANVRYMKTEFVDKQKTNDQTRLAIIERATDLIRVREDAFTALIDEAGLKVYNGADHVAAIVFNPDGIADYVRQIEQLGLEKAVHLYVFSLSNYAYQDELPETKLEITTCPIPESVLEVYQRILKKKGNRHV